MCVDIQYAVAVSIHNVIHIFRDLRARAHAHSPKMLVFLRRVHINMEVDEFADARKSANRERVGRTERIRVSRKRVAAEGEGTRGKREHTSCHE